MEYSILAGKLGAVYVEGVDPKDSASISPFNTIYSPETPVMQFTGLHDKNGKEIYEGDILKYVGSKCPCCEHETFYEGHKLYPVKWDEEEAGFVTRSDDNYMAVETWENSMEVIGNIYENPELLKA